MAGSSDHILKGGGLQHGHLHRHPDWMIGHTGHVYGMAMAITPPGSLGLSLHAMSGNFNKTLEGWDLGTGTLGCQGWYVVGGTCALTPWDATDGMWLVGPAC